MEDRYLYRGKRTDNGEWVYWNQFGECTEPLLTDECMCSHISEEYVDPDTVGQCTGLTDKNGVKVFEGDIATDGSTVLEIVWNSTHCWGCKVIEGGTLAMGLIFPLWQWDDCPQNANRQLKVIGTIHDKEGE